MSRSIRSDIEELFSMLDDSRTAERVRPQTPEHQVYWDNSRQAPYNSK